LLIACLPGSNSWDNSRDKYESLGKYPKKGKLFFLKTAPLSYVTAITGFIASFFTNPEDHHALAPNPAPVKEEPVLVPVLVPVAVLALVLVQVLVQAAYLDFVVSGILRTGS
jgi:hypothetical protein